MQTTISKTSKVLLGVTAIMLAISIFAPIWRIELDAPQYPEGLMMQIYSYKIGGQVDIINGLNHYIGMQTLHAENFIEFTVLPYIIGFYSLLMLLTLFVANKKILYFSFGAFVAFGIISMIDFWRWEYNYGHNLDPSAAIIVPGMSYQPPLIGYKQLLNFGAYSIPDIGGWLFVLGGVFILVAVLIETGIINKLLRKKSMVTSCIILLSLAVVSCNGSGASEPIKQNEDKCDFCAMTIADGRFGAELITKKGRAYKFDDIHCMLRYKKENTSKEFERYYINNYSSDNLLIDATKAYYLKHEALRSPMGGNYAAFESLDSAQKYSEKYETSINTWNDISNQ